METGSKESMDADVASPTPRYMFYQGYDRAPALSFDEVTKLTTGTVIRIIGFYIGGPNYISSDRNSDNSAISFTKELRTQYLSRAKLAYLYVGRSDQDVLLKTPEKAGAEAESLGRSDASEAIRLANRLNIPADSVIYLDIEGGDAHNEGAISYVKSWVKSMNGSMYWAGIYCSGGAQCANAHELYKEVNGKANMYVARWMVDKYYCYDMETETSYRTSFTNPAKWYDIDPRGMVPDMGNVVRQYSGDVSISLQGVNTVVDQIVANMPDPSVRQFEL